MFRRPSFNRRHRIAQNSSPYRRKRLASGAFPDSPKPHASTSSSRMFGTNRPDVNPKRTSRNFAKHSAAFDTIPNIDEEDSDSDDSVFHWEEAALLSDWMEEGPLQPDDEVLDELADSLQGSFTLKGRHLKREIAETLVGTHNHVKVIYQLLDETIDPSFGRGVSLFNKACKTLEQTVQLEQIEFESAYKATQEKIQALFEELKSEYQVRDKLWAELKKSIDHIVISAIERVKDAPARVERTIVRLEKHDKSLGNTSADIETVTKTLQQLLKAA